ncbi:PREDICTED: elongator complex protein 6 [Tinamus guttatus]|uniref:elongator complex protein 6 n=1 Tax=Tinamus guttatus TaxID=94827 RepID=UPI00052F04F2|nr:PREDICTED: elongator complex protein 6 [Tinamus guttatus]
MSLLDTGRSRCPVCRDGAGSSLCPRLPLFQVFLLLSSQGKFTLLRDTRTDGSFLVHHFLSFYLRAGCKVCFVALLQSFSHYNIVAQKLGVNLTAAKERGQLVFLEGLGSCLDVVFGEEEPEEEQEAKQPHPLQFLSGTFVHYCRVAVCSRLQGNIVMLVHSDEDSEDKENELLVTSLCHHSDLILWADSIPSALCSWCPVPSPAAAQRMPASPPPVPCSGMAAR